MRLAREVTIPGRIGGKASKPIHGTRDRFHRLRVGDLRIMYDVLDEARVVLVLGMVDRGELERWIKDR
jgi:mRNA-degrading endonuclease RelE of RelBE toxin-antitoxin system